MKLVNRNTDYAMRALSYIAQRKDDVISVRELSRRLNISYPFLRKILQFLHKNGLLKAFEGRDGGFSLARPADKIFVVDLIKIFQGPVKLADCLFKKSVCPDTAQCLLKRKIEHIEHLVDTELKNISIASLSSHHMFKKEPKRGGQKK